MLKLDTSNVIDKLSKHNSKRYERAIKNIVNSIELTSAKGCEMMGWYSLPNTYDSTQLLAMKKKAAEWKKHRLAYVVVIGIGGSYVGVRAAIDMCCGAIDKEEPEMIWVHNMGATYINNLFKKIGKKQFAIIVISKSGTTIEPAIGFRLFRELLEKRVGKDKAHKYIVAITDGEVGTLHEMAIKRHYTTFSIPNDIGGRFSVITPVGLFPMLVKGIDILQVLAGARQAIKDCSAFELDKNSAYHYACLRHYLYTNKSLAIENMIVYDPSMVFVSEMWRQIFGESEGKNHCGLYPDVSLFTTDLHSMGQYLQEGTRNFFETTIWVNQPLHDQTISIRDNVDKLKYLNKKTLHKLSHSAFMGTINAHTKNGKVNNVIIQIDKQDAFHFGYLFLWFAISLTISAYLLGINPFNQPGVEAYKHNMFKLLGKKKS